jgi:Holliday junction resolvase RusA-like endonuclease
MIPITEIPAALLRPQGCYRWEIPGPAPGKPRQTQSDKWRVRPNVAAYRLWADQVRAIVRAVPPAERTTEIRLTARYEVPQSWSRRRRLEAIGTRKRTAPDGDNILKAATDALWKADAALGDLIVQRFWADRSSLEVEIRVE